MTGTRRYTPPSGRQLTLGGPDTPQELTLPTGRTLRQNGDPIRRDLLWASGQPGIPGDLLQRYWRWDAHRQEEFERALSVIREMAPRQYELLLASVLAPRPSTAALAQELGVADGDIRNARMRALRLLHRYAGDWIDHAWP